MSSANQRAAGLIMPRLDAEHWDQQEYRDAAYRLVDLGVGGFGVFKGTLEATAMMIAELQQRSGNRLIFAADFEYGLPMRITEGGVAMPRAMALGKGSVEQTEAVAAAVAREMRALGVHWNWAPVADIASDPYNPIISVRSFGESKEVVSAHVRAWIRGSQGEMVAACLKHAPGHGATQVDSHLEMPTIAISAERASRREFSSFRAGIDEGVASIMMGHLLVPFLDNKHPASLSSAVVNGLLRDTWGYNGIIITDALDMGAITKRYASGDAAVRAVRAGNDVVLMPQDTGAAIAAIAKAIDKGVITDARLTASEDRWKLLHAQIRKWPRSPTINQTEHATLALQAASQALTFEGNAALLPLTQYTHAAVFGVVRESDAPQATQWFQFLAQATEMNIDFGYVDGTIGEEDLQALISGIEDADVLVFGFFGFASAIRTTLPGYEQIAKVITTLARRRPVIMVSCGNPYGIESLPSNLAIYAFSDTTPSLAAMVLTLIGKRPSLAGSA